MTEVAAAILIENGRVLIGQREMGDNCGLLWEFPGGKVEAGESHEECLLREVKEELGLGIRVLDFFGRAQNDDGSEPIALYFYLAAGDGGAPECRVHRDLRWVERSDLPVYAFCPADIEIVRRLVKAPAALFDVSFY